MGLDVLEDGGRLRAITGRIKELEHDGYQFEAADASFKLLVESCMGRRSEFFDLSAYSVTSLREAPGNPHSEASVRIALNGIIREAVAEGCGPVHALDSALRRALGDAFECLGDVHLSDYKVRVLGGSQGTSAKVRVLIQMSDGEETWNTMGVSENILEASLRALTDGINYKLLKSNPVPVPGAVATEG
jgi:2-isopropylmalate synthase